MFLQGEKTAADWLAEDPEKLACLDSFCEFVGKNPDELLSFCFLKKKESGETFTSKKRRDKVQEQVRDYCRESELQGTAARRMKSNIVSFLTHNGVLM